MGVRIGIALLALLAFAGCSADEGDLKAQVPHIPEQIALNKASPAELARRRVARCSPDKFSFSFLEDTNQFKSFFDCANYNYQFQQLEPFFHSPAAPGFIDAFKDSVVALSTSSNAQNIRELLAPWFQEYKGTGEAKVDHVLPIVPEVIKSALFRKTLPLLATMLDHGEPVWNTALQGLSLLVYNSWYPELWNDVRKLFNIYETGEGHNLLALSTREFFEFLRKDNLHPNGSTSTNAMFLLELADDLNNFKTLEYGFIHLFEYANNRDIFSALYQTGPELMRGEKILPGLNQSEADMKAKVDSLFVGGRQAPLLQLIEVVREFNEPRPNFLPAISQWFSSNKNKERMHRGIFEFIGRRLTGEILSDFPISKYINKYIRNNYKNIRYEIPKEGGQPGEMELVKCRRRSRCEVPPSVFMEIFDVALGDPKFIDFVRKELQKRARLKFGPLNSELLFEYGAKYEADRKGEGELVQRLVQIYRSSDLREYTESLFKDANSVAVPKIRISTAISIFSKMHFLEEGQEVDGLLGPRFVFRGEEDTAYEHIVQSILDVSQKAWGSSIIIDEAFRVSEVFLSELADKLKENGEEFTLSQWLFRSTYSDPDFIERIVFEGRRLKILGNLDEKIRWLKEDIGSEIFAEGSEDLQSFRMLVDQIPNFLIYIESGMSRSGKNMLRVFSDRDDGYLIRKWVDILCEAYDQEWTLKFLPVWKDFIDYMNVKQKRLKEKNAEIRAAMNEQENRIEDFREARRRADGVHAMRAVGVALLRPQNDDDNFDESLLGKMLVSIAPLANVENRQKTEYWLVELSNRVVAASDDEINGVYKFFAGKRLPLDASEEQIEEQHKFRKNIAELMREESFPQVLVELDRLFKDQAVAPALDFIRDKIDDQDADRILELVRKILGIRKYRSQ